MYDIIDGSVNIKKIIVFKKSLSLSLFTLIAHLLSTLSKNINKNRHYFTKYLTTMNNI